MEDRAKELARKLREISRIGFDIPIEISVLNEIADLLDPQSYPSDGELVEVVCDAGWHYYGKANDDGVTITHPEGMYGIPWSNIKDYRIIHEAKDFVPHPNTWREGTSYFNIKAYETGDFRQNRTITRAEAEEIHRELK